MRDDEQRGATQFGVVVIEQRRNLGLLQWAIVQLIERNQGGFANAQFFGTER